jgi:Tfp pilus assembly protein PilX
MNLNLLLKRIFKKPPPSQKKGPHTRGFILITVLLALTMLSLLILGEWAQLQREQKLFALHRQFSDLQAEAETGLREGERGLQSYCRENLCVTATRLDQFPLTQAGITVEATYYQVTSQAHQGPHQLTLQSTIVVFNPPNGEWGGVRDGRQSLSFPGLTY